MSPGGTPIKASTKQGFSDSFSRRRTACIEPSAPPVGIVGSGGEAHRGAWRPSNPFVGTASEGSDPSFQSRAVGVAHIAVASVSDVPACVLPVLAAVALRPPDAFASPAVAVGDNSASFASIGRFVRAASFPVCVRVVAPASGVGQNGASVGSSTDGVSLPEETEHPLAPVRRANVAGGTEHRRLQSVAHSDQRLSESPNPPKSNEIWDILDEDQGRLALADDARQVADEVSRVVSGGASSSARIGLTGDSASDEIHNSTPRASVEGGNVRPDRRRSHGSRFHRRDQVCGGECFPLHVAHGASRLAGEVQPSLESGVSGADAEGT